MVKKSKTLWIPHLPSVAIFLASLLNFGGCTFGNLSGVGSASSNQNSVHKKTKWTFMVYMAADNNLENAAVEDFNEMEASGFDTENANIIVLFDRNSIKDSCDSDEWNGTRMFEVRNDKNGMNNVICSKRIPCSDLGLSSKNETSLDLGSPKTLSGFIKNVKDFYPAEHYGLFIWGHGTGYRSSCVPDNQCRAVALDDGSDSFMENCVAASAIKNGMENDKLDFLIYDTCFAGELEVVYEYPDVADYFMGSQGIQTESGLDYEKVFESGIEESESGLKVAEHIGERLSGDMKNNFSVINLSEIKNVFSSFESFASNAASLISKKDDADEIRNLVLKESECFKSFESSNNPVYVNILSFAGLLTEKYSGLMSYKNLLFQSIKKAVCFYSGTNENLPLGIYFCSVDSSNNLITEFSPYYYGDSNLNNQSSFVKKSKGYVLTKNKSGTLLDRLFGNYSFKFL